MYLKKLEIAGFKSFANTTTLTFPAPVEGRFGITGIVGPNGSGKSNTADAIRWVLGEQSVKQLRGKKSEDVIFGGSEGRGKMSLASVSMVLDNSDKRAGLDYDELVLTRRLYRTGESEYLINGSPVRLLDLQIVLAQAQFGHSSYGVVGQGMIDRLLLQTATERKSFFDEAVGIKEFQLKRHHAYLKLTRTHEHIREADRLLQEVEPHLKSLRRQVKKLEERQEVELALRETQERYYANQYRSLSVHMAEYDQKITVLDRGYAAAHEKLARIQSELAELAREASQQEQFNELQNKHQALVNQKNDFERERSVLAGKLQTEYAKAGRHNVGWLEQKIADLQQRATISRVDLEAAQKQLAAAQAEAQTKAGLLADLETKKLAAETRRSVAEKKLFDARQSEQDLSLTGLRSAQAILQHQHQFGGTVHGLVAQLATTREEHRLALEVAAGAHLSSLVVEDDRVAERAIAYLKQAQLGVATFLPLNKIKARPLPHDIDYILHQPGVLGLAVDLVKFRAEFEPIFSFIYGSTIVVENIEAARSVGIGRVRMVTLDGDLLETSGSMKGGFRRRTAVGLHFAASAGSALSDSAETYQQEITALQQELTQIETARNQAQQAVFTAQNTAAARQQRIELLVAQDQGAAQEIAALELELSLYSLNPEEYSTLMARLSEEKETVATKISKAETDVAAVAAQIAALNAAAEHKRQRVFALQDEMQIAQADLNVVAANKNTVQIELVKLQTRREDLANEIFNELKEQPGILEQRVGGVLSAAEVDEAKAKIETLKYKLSQIGGIDEEVMREYETANARFENLTTELNDLKKAAADITELIAELDEVMKKKHTQAFSKIKKEFSRYFSILFEGGKAELIEVYSTPDAKVVEGEEGGELAEEAVETTGPVKTKILTGIEVTACPPGKKITNLAALSGGERTLTSIALVCAILHTNPPPFVFLDEVEAALDEANTLRFTRILQELATRSQFILITHNRTTMHAADVLYGVTMGNDGVSRLVSVNMTQAASVVEPKQA